MAGFLPVAFFGLEVPADGIVQPTGYNSSAIQITMAALDPSAEPMLGSAVDGSPPRSTLKVFREPLDSDSESDSELDSLEKSLWNPLANGDLSDEEDSDSDDEEMNGGPSDPSRSKKKLKSQISMKTEEANPSDISIKKIDKGKAIATDDDEDSSSEGSDDFDLEEHVVCTLDTTQHYQQPLNITIQENERVYFKVSGTHSIYLTGNYVMEVDDTPRGMFDEEDDEDDEDDDVSLLSDEELDELDDLGESDDLDDLEDPRIVELAGEDEDETVPTLVKKGKNKRAKPDSDEEMGLDEMMAQSASKANAVNGDANLSKKQKKKLKNNAGEAKPAEPAKAEAEPSGKKVQFAKNLEQGPTAKTKPQEKASDTGKKANGVDIKVVKGVTVEERKVGKGPAAKAGNKVAMRYIGKLKDGKQFDANKKGKPYAFKLGAGEVIDGWDIGLEGIRAGGERRLIIPAKHAYRNRALPGIPANSELTFDVKCLSVE